MCAFPIPSVAATAPDIVPDGYRAALTLLLARSGLQQPASRM